MMEGTCGPGTGGQIRSGSRCRAIDRALGTLSVHPGSGMRRSCAGRRGLMIVWGTSISNKVLDFGQFYCPGCRQRCGYALRQDQKWATIYWVRVVSLEKSEPYVECAECNGTFPEAV